MHTFKVLQTIVENGLNCTIPTSEDICIHGLEVEGSQEQALQLKGMVLFLPAVMVLLLQESIQIQMVVLKNVLEQYTINQMRLYIWGSIELYTPDGVQLDQLSHDSKNTHRCCRLFYFTRVFGQL